MKLTIFNGSPRNKKSNSKILTDHFLEGFGRICPEAVTVHYLADRNAKEEEKEIFRTSETVIIIFPLYTDCMPGIVKEFIENVSQIEFTGRKKLGFIVQSGFPEAIHSSFIEKYLEKLTARLKCEYLGTIIKGGVEGIQSMPPMMTKKLFRNFEMLGEYFAEHTAFAPDLKAKLRKPYKMSAMGRFIFGALIKTGVTNFYWNSKLKENGAFKERFAKPYAINAK